MKQEFYRIYNDMYHAYREMQWRRRFPFRLLAQLNLQDESLREIEQFVEGACREKKIRLRPDAKFFLVSNFHQMIAVPFTHPAAPPNQAKEIMPLIEDDIYAIIYAVAQEKTESDISGGLIFRTTAKIWDELKTNAQNVWS